MSAGRLVHELLVARAGEACRFLNMGVGVGVGVGVRKDESCDAGWVYGEGFLIAYCTN